MDRQAILERVRELHGRLMAAGTKAERDAPLAREVWEGLRGLPELVPVGDAEVAVPLVALVGDMVLLGHQGVEPATFVLSAVHEHVIRYHPVAFGPWVLPAGVALPPTLSERRAAVAAEQYERDQAAALLREAEARASRARQRFAEADRELAAAEEHLRRVRSDLRPRTVPAVGQRVVVLGDWRGEVARVDLPNVYVRPDGGGPEAEVFWANVAPEQP